MHDDRTGGMLGGEVEVAGTFVDGKAWKETGLYPLVSNAAWFAQRFPQQRL